MTDEHIDTRFTAAQVDWDLDRLYQDLANNKGRPLSPMEKLHLRGLLCGYSPNQIAKVLRKSPKGVHVDLAKTLYPYMAAIAGQANEGIGNWRNFRLLAEKMGYKKTQPPQVGQSSNTGQSSNISISQSYTANQPSNAGTIVNILTASIVEIHAETIYVGENEYIDINFRLGPFPSVNSPKKNKQD